MDDTPKPKLILVGPYSLPHGGIQSYLRQLIAQLDDKGYEYSVLDTRSEKDALCRSGPLRIAQRTFKYLFLLFKLIWVEGQVVHCFSSSYGNFYANGLLVVCAKITGRKTVISMLGGGWPSVVQNASFFKRALIQLIFRGADHVIACNEHIKDSITLLAIRAQKISLVSNALPIAISTNEPLSSELQNFLHVHIPVVVSVSALLPEYGVVTLIQALMRLRAQFYDIGLVLIVLSVADSTLAQEVHDMIERDGLSQNVLILKNVSSAAAIIGKGDLFVRPNLLDGDSVSVREALFLGVPVVASDTAFRPEEVVLFKRGDVNDLYDKMKRVIESKETFSPTRALDEARSNFKKIEILYRQLSTSA